MSKSERGEGASAKIFRALLNLYPAAFRDEYDRELTLLFIDRYRDAAKPWDRARLWLDVVHGLALEVPKEHYRMILQDLRYAWRSVRHHWIVTIAIVFTLAAGIGVNTALFSLLNTIVLRPLPVPDPHELFAVTAGPGSRFSGPMFQRLQKGAPEDVEVAAMSRVARVYTRADGTRKLEPAALQLVSSNYFRALRVSPALGRPFPVEADSPVKASPVAIVSHGYWQRRLGGEPDVVGKAITINGTSFTIIGVCPQGFAGVWLESPVDIWVPLTMQGAVKYSQNFSADRADLSSPWLPQETIWWLDVIVRSNPARTAAVTAAFRAAVRDWVKGGEARLALQPFSTGFSGLRQRFMKPLYALIAMAGLVLLIACGNIANLLLSRAADRRREIALRMSLGAGRPRILRQLLTESVLLAVMAGALAVLFAEWAGNLLARTATDSANGAVPFSADLDWRVLIFTAALSLASALLFGLMPAWRATRTDLIAALKGGTQGVSGGDPAKSARLLVVAQVALSLVLVTATGLIVQSFRNLLEVNLGFDRAHLLSVAIDPRLSDSAQMQDPNDLHQRLLDAVTAVPGVRSASLAMCGLHSSCRARESGFQVEGYQARPDEEIRFLVNSVTPDYFSTVGMRLLAGRTFDNRDRANTRKVAVVNSALATKYFQDGQAIGRRFGNPAPDIEIVGIVEDARVFNVKDPAAPAAFFPLVQRPVAVRDLQIWTYGDPQQIAAAVREALRRAVPDLAIEGIVTMDERIRLNLSQERLLMLLTSGFGVLALGLAGLGLFAIQWHAVARRTPELGIRMALGASQWQVRGQILHEGLWLVLCGCLLGLPFVVLAGKLISSLLFGVTPHNWQTLLGAVILLLLVGAGCSLLPAARASRVDPAVALRQE